ncbi:MAG TPA: MBL fold metallo-hydrolase [Vicinamibacterales bacterium]|jgi:metallo-beta-lactamase family protein|nr:MBL fold metallo-hydrolase [Vicinamibacterales bacterium]
MSSTSITFLGAARTVTGSKHLLETSSSTAVRAGAGPVRVLIDCGMFQGIKELRERNWQPLPVDPASINALVLTHAHLDHVGWLPRLVAGGFAGRVFCTVGTADLAKIVLADAAKLQEEDAAQANRGGYSRHRPALPLFTEEDAMRAMTLLQPVGYERPMPVADGVEAEFINAGHLLGSAYARVRVDGMQVLFGGDLGRYDRPILPDPAPVAECDFLLLESTYGDRRHEPDDNGEQLARIINETARRRGKVIVPAFAIGRVEEVVFWLKKLEAERRIPILPVYLDSPMAAAAMKLYEARQNELDPEVRANERGVCVFCTTRFTVISSPRDSHELVKSDTSAIIIASSGMATGGRVLNHLKATLPDPRHTILFVGFQAAGTRGRQILEGAPRVKIHGAEIPVAAQTAIIHSMSAHADQGEILRWLGYFRRPPTRTFLVHGEPAAQAALREAIIRKLDWNVYVPEHEERAQIK